MGDKVELVVNDTDRSIQATKIRIGRFVAKQGPGKLLIAEEQEETPVSVKIKWDKDGKSKGGLI